jgi:hypothetical protein
MHIVTCPENAIKRHADGLVLIEGNPFAIKRKGGQSFYAKLGKDKCEGIQTAFQNSGATGGKK